jgi:hypothetical protein
MARRTLLLTLTVLAALVGGYAARTIGSGSDVNLEIRLGNWQDPYEACLRETPETKASQCLQDLSARASGTGDIGGALAVLRDGLTRSSVLVGKCHAAVHTVGQNAVKKGVDLYEAYQIPFSDCRFGFYHGALEAHTSSLDLAGLEQEFDDLCAPFGGEDAPAAGECVHVLGHFVYDRTKPDIDNGLRICGRIPTERLQARCSDGVLMQSVDLVKPAVDSPTHERYGLLEKSWGTTRDAQLRRANDLCDKLTSNQSTYVCYTNIPQAFTILWKGDYPALHQYCRQDVPEQWRQPCFEGIAAGGFSWLDWDEKRIADACHESDDPATRFCMGTLAFTFALQSTRERAMTVCTLARDYEKETCLAQVEAGVAAGAGIADGVPTGDDYGIYSE